jgi:hypothetical protein
MPKLSTGSKQLEWLKVSDLRISSRAQRDHAKPGAQRLIESICADFDPDKFGTLVVSERDGVHWVIDGGHRRTALSRMGYDDQMVQCWVYHGLSETEEAGLFLDLNNSRPVSGMDKFKVAVVAGRDDECDIDRIVRAAGLTVGTSKVASVSCPGALKNVYTGGGPQVLATTLCVLRDAYGTPGFSAKMVEGMGLFVAHYANLFEEHRLKTKLSHKLGGVNGLLSRAEQIKSSYGVRIPEAVAAAITETYNSGRGGGGKLPSWWTTVEPAIESQTSKGA